MKPIRPGENHEREEQVLELQAIARELGDLIDDLTADDFAAFEADMRGWWGNGQ